MQLAIIDVIVIATYLLVALMVGAWSSRRAGNSSEEFFLSGRNMPGWLLGISMVATTFAIDTPNLVTDIVRNHGVAGNWLWWAMLLTGMMTVFLFARLWRRSGVMTDIEIYELRYSGKPAALLRGFRAIYLGVFFNILIMAAVTLAAIKLSAGMFDFPPAVTVVIAGTVTVIYSTMGGLRSVLLTDLVLFALSMCGAVLAAVYALNHPAVGGLENLMSHSQVTPSLSFFPDFSDPNIWVPLFFIPLALQWWSIWYPGAEPGGGGYVAQRMLAAKSEKHALGAAFLFNALHYAARPWPWIIVALCSLVVYPDLAALQLAFPNIDGNTMGHDLAYPAMLTFLPNGALGLVVVSLIAAYMSTISTSLNWGASYVVNDVYKRFIKTGASEQELVTVGRWTTVFLMVFASTLALFLENQLQAFQIMLNIGAGTGLIFILRWFWWRINAFSELTAMVVSFLAALYFEFLAPQDLADWQVTCLSVGVTTFAWLLATFVFQPASAETLQSFYQLIQPGGPGWARVKAQLTGDQNFNDIPASPLTQGISAMFLGCAAIYGLLFATGSLLFGHFIAGGAYSLLALAGGWALWRLWPRL